MCRPPRFHFWTDSGDQAFSCELQQVRCAYKAAGSDKQCDERIYIGLPFCPEHLMQAKHLAIRPSGLVPGQLGLFAASSDHGARGVVFRPGQRVIEYIGEDISETELHRRYGATDAYVAPYAVCTSKNRYMDGACVRGAAAFANGAARASGGGANAVMYITPANSSVDARKLMLRATKRVRNGDEIICVYGTEYFRDDDASHHRTEYLPPPSAPQDTGTPKRKKVM